MTEDPLDWLPAPGTTGRGRARYARWDGSQRIGELDADALLDALTDEAMADGDLDEALRRAIEEGIPPRADGSAGLRGLRDLMRRLAERRREVLDRHGLDDVMRDLRDRLREIVATERDGIERRLAEAGGQDARGLAGEAGSRGDEGGAAPDHAQRRMVSEMALRRRATLDALPGDLGDQVRALEQYEFLEPAARDAFQHLLERLRGRVLDATFKGLTDRLRSTTPDDMRATRGMVRELEQLLRERLQGGPADAGEFLQQHGGLFPGAQNLDDILAQLADGMAAMHSLVASLDEGQRAELTSLMDALLRDDRLQYDLARLGALLQQILPGGLGERLPFRRADEMGLEEALDQIEALQAMDRLSGQLAGADDPPALAAIDPDDVRRLLGEESAEDLAALQRAAVSLEEAGYVRHAGDRLELTPRGQRRIGQRILDEVFGRLGRDAFGGHPLHRSGGAGERTGASAAYEFGRPFDLDLRGTLERAVARELGTARMPGDGARMPGSARRPARAGARGVTVEPGDFQVYEAEVGASASTVLLLDMSRSMLLRGCVLAAKKVAIALDTLIRTRYPRDRLHVVGFAYMAREIAPGSLATLSWEGHEYGTNLQHALMLARRLLAAGSPTNRSIIVITDGEPTAHIEDGRVDFNYPPTRRTIEETLREVGRCTRDGITINTFMLERSRALAEFVDRLTRMNRGRAFYASPDRLEEFVLVDYLERRTRRSA